MTALYFHPEGYSTAGGKVMGRQSAGASFLRGFLAHARTDTFWIEVAKREHAQHFAEAARAAGRHEPVRAIERETLGSLAEPGTLHQPGPELANHAWPRGQYGHGAWSITGLTHTTSSAAAMTSITDFLAAPVQRWDALICTSRAVKANVEALLEAQAAMLRARLGATRFVLPQLPVIPLGINTADFAFTPQQRAAARARIGADEATRVVLFAGRLSFHAKAHPLAMYQAIDAAARALDGRCKVLLVECGWHATEAIAKDFQAAAGLACPSLRCLTLDSRDDAARLAGWASADVFCSLSDNIQEAFGLTPVEAMAAGLPAIVSDWDGYKDTVRDGLDGIRIPTLMPGPGLATDLAQRHALGLDDFDLFSGRSCNLVAVDIARTTEAMIALLGDPARARALGQSGQRRARTEFDWAALIPRYFELWDELKRIRTTERDRLPRLAHPWPARMDPLSAFAGYPTATLAPETRFARVDPSVAAGMERLAAYQNLWMGSFDRIVPPRPAEIRAVLEHLEAGPATARDLVADVARDRAAHVFRGLVWLAKLGLIRQVD
jgi:glycosyltransferase involved in cell wall biosynthesis